ncbi:hypothetical protein G6F22_002742 [Rhizopus arrhizus]|nr:hypothetical protein G6F23_004395 [Rhizopus arrhizus]KAG0799927.1 hypothetical protein G6F22_002742 [Rhizopus arrhizus]KAG1222588.1 hypothetical protein G6F35_005199 [Rhizopus arrhizus]
MNNNSSNQFNDDSLFYASLDDMMPTTQQENYINESANNTKLQDNSVKQEEYTTLEDLSKQQENIHPSGIKNQSPKLSDTPTASVSTPSNMNFINWDNLDQPQGKIPIQRLKSINTVNNAVNAVLNSSSATHPAGGRQQKKTAHNAIERRYRNNINDRITELKNAVPALLYAKVNHNKKRPHKNNEEEDSEDGEEYLDGVAVATKLNKATILRKATEYINHLKRTGEHIRRENGALQNILVQLPGGSEILQQYHLQKQQREQELRRQHLLEREFQKQEIQSRKKNDRKRTKYSNHSDEYESSPSSPDPVTPPAVTANRVFMAMFMAISLFSTSPLTTTGNSEHHHVSRAPGVDNNLTKQDANAATLSFSFFQFDSFWSTLKTLMFVACLIQLCLPLFKTLFFKSIKFKRVARRTKRQPSSNSNVTSPGELKCKQMYSILNHPRPLLPTNSFFTFLLLIKEATRFFFHHVLSYDVLYDHHESEEQAWAQFCRWIKLNEILCFQGASTPIKIYACLNMINQVDLLDEDDDNQTRTRAYATAALQLTTTSYSLAKKLADYLWDQAADGAPKKVEEGSGWMLALAWMHPVQAHGSIRSIPETRAWSETLEILENQQAMKEGLCLSYTAPVLVPVMMLSTLHLLDHLRIQFERLVSLMALQGNPTEDEEDEEDGNESDAELESHDGFETLILLTEPYEEEEGGDEQRLVHWFATLGAVVEALWKNKTDQIERHLPGLIQRVPRSMTSRSLLQRSTLNQSDEIIKKTMIRTLVGSALVRHPDSEKQKQGLTELRNAERLKRFIEDEESDRVNDLESTVLSLAECVVSLIGLEAWTMAIRFEEGDKIKTQAKECAAALKKMILHDPYLKSFGETKFIVKKLKQLKQFLARQSKEEKDGDLKEDGDENAAKHEALMKCVEKAHSILHD